MRVGLLIAGVVSVLMVGSQMPAPGGQIGTLPPPGQETPTATPLSALVGDPSPAPVGEWGGLIVVPADRSPQPPAATPPQSRGSAASVNCRRHKCIALTLDDGPSRQTARILDELAALKAPATFFVIGQQAVRYPALLRRMVAEGHTIGNHSWSHPWFWKLSATAMRSELDKTDRAIRKITGVQPTYVRPPYGNVNAAVRLAAKSRGLAIIDWSIDPQDWKDRNTATVIKRVTKAARPGAIILSHDLYPTTRKAIGAIITGLRAKGYQFVSLDDLLGHTRPGKVYRQR